MNIWNYLQTYRPREVWKKHPDKNRRNRRRRIRFDYSLRFEIHKASKEDAIEKLKVVAERVESNSIAYEARRKSFDRNKYKYHKQWKKCAVCKKNNVDHIHHMIMLKNGGSNHPSNLIGVCMECHIEIHPWMKNENINP